MFRVSCYENNPSVTCGVTSPYTGEAMETRAPVGRGGADEKKAIPPCVALQHTGVGFSENQRADQLPFLVKQEEFCGVADLDPAF